jgi:hypothetical protein
LSSSSALSPQESNESAQSAHAAADPVKNPSYPQRVHFGERRELQDKLASWDEKIAAMARKLATLGAHPHRAPYERLYHQMQGARDQMAECVRRMPLETGILYDEDRERLNGAEAALARTLQRWVAVGA